MFSTAKIGCPAVTFPTMGTFTISRVATSGNGVTLDGEGVEEDVTFNARVLEASLCNNPFFSKASK